MLSIWGLAAGSPTHITAHSTETQKWTNRDAKKKHIHRLAFTEALCYFACFSSSRRCELLCVLHLLMKALQFTVRIWFFHVCLLCILIFRQNIQNTRLRYKKYACSTFMWPFGNYSTIFTYSEYILFNCVVLYLIRYSKFDTFSKQLSYIENKQKKLLKGKKKKNWIAVNEFSCWFVVSRNIWIENCLHSISIESVMYSRKLLSIKINELFIFLFLWILWNILFVRLIWSEQFIIKAGAKENNPAYD